MAEGICPTAGLYESFDTEFYDRSANLACKNCWKANLMDANFSVVSNTHSAQASRSIAPPVRAEQVKAKLDRQWTLPGLCWNASVTTSFGALPAQVLRLHDPLRLADGTIARITWIDKIQLDDDFLAAYPDAQPIMVRAGALGGGLPVQDLLVSPQQMIAVKSNNFKTEVRMAREFLGRPGFMRSPQSMVTYYLFHCGRPAQVMVEGLALHTAP